MNHTECLGNSAAHVDVCGTVLRHGKINGRNVRNVTSVYFRIYSMCWRKVLTFEMQKIHERHMMWHVVKNVVRLGKYVCHRCIMRLDILYN
mmetsp:Transcript_19939/g.33608  ORF Transcript_19939/g.33608 Transcript_19939/m.33608 type:complete len:91 (-) Transcript_19939:107-379(-)